MTPAAHAPQEQVRSLMGEGGAEHAAAAVALAGVVVQDLKARRVRVGRARRPALLTRRQDYEFSWARMLQTEGDTGPMLMYTHARCASIEARAAAIPVRCVRCVCC